MDLLFALYADRLIITSIVHCLTLKSCGNISPLSLPALFIRSALVRVRFSKMIKASSSFGTRVTEPLDKRIGNA